MPKLIICRGVAGAGKSTWTLEQVEKDPSIVRVNKDTIRLAHGLVGKGWSKKAEAEIVVPERDRMIAEGLAAGRDVISDDTNLQKVHIKRLTEIAQSFGAKVEIKTFEIDIKEAIRRDSLRKGIARVGEEVIRKMYKDFYGYEELEPYVPDVSKPRAVLVDLDGTISLFCKDFSCKCDMNHRNPYLADTASDDTINRSVVFILERVSIDTEIIFLSGREDKFRKPTEIFLNRTGISYSKLLMRNSGDNRKDSIVKLELFNKYIRENYNVQAVIDDRLQVVRMWYKLGLPIFRVGDPDSDF